MRRSWSLVLVAVVAAAVGLLWTPPAQAAVTEEATTFTPGGAAAFVITCRQVREGPTVAGGIVVGSAITSCDLPVTEMQILVELFLNGNAVGAYGHDQGLQTNLVQGWATATCVPGFWAVYAQTYVMAPAGYIPPESVIYPSSLHTTFISPAECLPIIISMTDDAARTKIAELGLNVGTVTRQASSAPVGNVLSWSLRADGTTVDLVESAGNATVPDLIGGSQATAQQRILAAGLTVGQVTTTRVAESFDAGKVWIQTPAAGAPTNVGNAVDISVGVFNGNPGGGRR